MPGSIEYMYLIYYMGKLGGIEACKQSEHADHHLSLTLEYNLETNLKKLTRRPRSDLSSSSNVNSYDTDNTKSSSTLSMTVKLEMKSVTDGFAYFIKESDFSNIK